MMGLCHVEKCSTEGTVFAILSFHAGTRLEFQQRYRYCRFHAQRITHEELKPKITILN